MKSAGILLILFISSISFGDAFYVRKSVTGNGVTEAQGEQAREGVRAALKTQGKEIAHTPGPDKTTLRAFIEKQGNNYVIRIEKSRAGKVLNSSSGSGAEVADTAKQVTMTLSAGASPSPEALPENDKNVVVEDHSPAADVTPGSTDPSPVLAHEKDHPNFVKHTYIGLGPVLSNNLLGSNGTKFNIDIAFNQGLAEHWDLRYFYNGDFNTGSLGSTAVTAIGAGIVWIPRDRGAETSPFLSVDVAYGGNNRGNDAAPIIGGTIGFDFFRTQEVTFEVSLREFSLVPSGGTLQNWPSETEFRFGILF